MDAPPGWVAKHIADVRVVGEPWAGTGMFPAVMWPKNESIKAWLRGLGAYPTQKDFWGFVTWLRKGQVSGVMRPKKAPKGKQDVHTWRADIATAIRNQAPWDKQLTGPVIVQSTYLMPRPQRLKDGGRQPFVRPRFRDLGNLEKPEFDAVTDSGLWADDAQAFKHISSKWYAASNEEPGVEISFWELVERVEPSLFDPKPRKRRP